MRDLFHEKLGQLGRHVRAMADHGIGMLMDGVRSFEALDRAAAQTVMDRSKQLAKFDDEIETEALSLLASQQPMARDMRELAAALKLITYLNRVGRYGRDIAQITLEWNYGKHEPLAKEIAKTAELVQLMFQHVLEVYSGRHGLDIPKLTEWENKLDKARWDHFRAALDLMVKQPKAIEAGAHYMMVARYLERCGDNICKMGEKVHYMSQGVRIDLG